MAHLSNSLIISRQCSLSSFRQLPFATPSSQSTVVISDSHQWIVDRRQNAVVIHWLSSSASVIVESTTVILIGSVEKHLVLSPHQIKEVFILQNLHAMKLSPTCLRTHRNRQNVKCRQHLRFRHQNQIFHFRRLKFLRQLPQYLVLLAQTNPLRKKLCCWCTHKSLSFMCLAWTFLGVAKVFGHFLEGSQAQSPSTVPMRCHRTLRLEPTGAALSRFGLTGHAPSAQLVSEPTRARFGSQMHSKPRRALLNLLQHSNAFQTFLVPV